MFNDVFDEVPVGFFFLFVGLSISWGFVLRSVHDIQLRCKVNNMMFRIISSYFGRFGYQKQRVLDIRQLIKKQGQVNAPEMKKQGGLRQRGEDEERKFGVRDVFRAIEDQKINFTKQELQINHWIKIQTKAFNLYKLYRQKHLLMTPKNLINLLIKILKLRKINPKEGQESTKFQKLLNSIVKQKSKMTPQDMIRFLFNMKKIKMKNEDLKKLQPLILTIIDEFSQRNMLQNRDANIYNSFQVISIESNLKLLHSLHHLKLISGDHFEPIVSDLVKMSIEYFDNLTKQKLKDMSKKNSEGKISMSFYFILVKYCGIYKMPLKVVKDFVKYIVHWKKFLVDRKIMLFNLANQLLTMSVVIQECRGSKIKQLGEIFQLFDVICEQLEKPYEVLEQDPMGIFKYAMNLNKFTDEEFEMMNFKDRKLKTFQRILILTNKFYGKFLNNQYETVTEKVSIEQWMRKAQGEGQYEYLPSLLLYFHKLIIDKRIPHFPQFNKLISTCIQNFSELTFCAQAAILNIGIERSFQNIKSIIDIFFNQFHQTSRSTKNIKFMRSFKKRQGIELYSMLFNSWNKILEISSQTLFPYRENSFCKGLLSNLTYYQNTNAFAYLLAKRICIDEEMMSYFVNKYRKNSIQNRSLGKSQFIEVQQNRFKKYLKGVSRDIHEKQDQACLHQYFSLKYRLRVKIKSCLKNLKFAIQIFEHLKALKGDQQEIVEKEEFKDILLNFDEEIRCLYFQELFTIDNFQMINKIMEYLRQKKYNFAEDSKLLQIEEWMQSLELDIPQGIEKTKLMAIKYGTEPNLTFNSVDFEEREDLQEEDDIEEE